jgi:hypothetical protein
MFHPRSMGTVYICTSRYANSATYNIKVQTLTLHLFSKLLSTANEASVALEKLNIALFAKPRLSGLCLNIPNILGFAETCYGSNGLVGAKC